MNFCFYLVLLVFWPRELNAACPTGWDTYNKNCYKKFDGPSTWDNAVSACGRENAMLAEIKDQAENDFVKDNLGGDAWLGISRCHTSSTCLLDFTPSLYTNWGARQPDNEPQNPPGLENKDFAVVIKGSGEWFDYPKDSGYAYICKRPDDLCQNNDCNPEGSTCKDGNCICKPGFSGPFCWIEPCDEDPCKNGGSCDVVDAGYKCTCVDNYSGKDCKVAPPCKSKKPCLNGAACVDISSVDYKCNCQIGWIGKNCDERPCDRNPCPAYKMCHNKGNTFECKCKTGWTGEKCERRCGAGGDPHYTTFDGKRYDFMGKCEYVYAKDCSKDHTFEVLQQNEACGRGTVSCTKSLRVLFNGIEVGLQRRGVVYVDGKRVNLPWQQSDIKITRYSGGAFLSVPSLLFSVRWDGYMRIEVNINQRYEGKMCGLAGNADGNPGNDFQLPDKTETTDIKKFANSWKKNPRCVNGIVPPDPCLKLSPTQYTAVKQKCGKMKQRPFNACNGRITPDVGHIPNCEYDVCGMKGNPSAAFCQALETYDRACSASGININWEGQPGFEECGNPCANMPCFNGAECKNINRKDYTCTCPKGFSGPTCANVDCRGGYIPRGNQCYKKMTRRPWQIARCVREEKFVVPANEDENKFIYENFIQKSKKTFWMNARVCDKDKLCRNDFGVVFYHNFAGAFPAAGCVEMRSGNGGKWSSAQNCRKGQFYVCKYEIF